MRSEQRIVLETGVLCDVCGESIPAGAEALVLMDDTSAQFLHPECAENNFHNNPQQERTYMALLNFDATSVDTTSSASFDAIPAGTYEAVVTDSELRETKNRSGHFLLLTFAILSGPYENRKLWARLNIDNPNSVAVEIARRELASICKAVGVLKPQDSSELHDKPMTIKVAVRKLPDGTETNEIKGYAAVSGDVSAPAQNKPAPKPAQDAAPWAR